MAFDNSKLVLAQQELPEVRNLLALAATHLAGIVKEGLSDASPADQERLNRVHETLHRVSREVDEAYRDLNDLYIERTTIE